VLLAAGADAGGKDAGGVTPLHEAARGGHLEMARMLLEKVIFFFFFTLVTGPRRPLGLKLSDTRV